MTTSKTASESEHQTATLVEGPTLTDVRHARERAGLSIADAAELMRVPLATWHQWEQAAVDGEPAPLRMTRLEFELFRVKAEASIGWIHAFHSALLSLRFAAGEGSLESPHPTGKNFNPTAARALRGVLPYCLHPMGEEHPELLIAVNRDYKPIGIYDRSNFVRYELYPQLHVKASDPKVAPLLAACVNRHGRRYLFDDGCAPWVSRKDAVAYLGKLSLLRPAFQGLKNLL